MTNSIIGFFIKIPQIAFLWWLLYLRIYHIYSNWNKFIAVFAFATTILLTNFIWKLFDKKIFVPFVERMELSKYMSMWQISMIYLMFWLIIIGCVYNYIPQLIMYIFKSIT